MKDEPAPVHQLDHSEPTVIHQPGEDMTILGRWLQRGMEQGARFWVLLGGAVVAVVAVAALANGLVASKSAGSDAWSELAQAKTAEDRIKVADAHPNTALAGWARLSAAQEEYANGVDDLTSPGRKELSGARLGKALKLFQQVASEATKDSSQAVGGLFGAARTLEARNELDEAVKQYKVVVERYPNSAEAKQSLALIKALDEPLNRMFYQELYAYKPPANPTPPSGLGSGFGGFGGPGSPLDPTSTLGQPAKSFLPSNLTPPAFPDIPPPPPSNATPTLEPPKDPAPKKDEAPAPAEATKPSEPAKAEPPASPK